MAQSNTVKSLAKKHAELQGNIHQVAAQLADMKEKLAAIENSISLFDSSYNPATFVSDIVLASFGSMKCCTDLASNHHIMIFNRYGGS